MMTFMESMRRWPRLTRTRAAGYGHPFCGSTPTLAWHPTQPTEQWIAGLLDLALFVARCPVPPAFDGTRLNPSDLAGLHARIEVAFDAAERALTGSWGDERERQQIHDASARILEPFLAKLLALLEPVRLREKADPRERIDLPRLVRHLQNWGRGPFDQSVIELSDDEFKSQKGWSERHTLSNALRELFAQRIPATHLAPLPAPADLLRVIDCAVVVLLSVVEKNLHDLMRIRDAMGPSISAIGGSRPAPPKVRGYVVEEDDLVAIGGQGEVWRAERGGRTVALKVLNADVLSKIGSKLDREIEGLKRLSEKGVRGVAHLIDHSTDTDGRRVIATEYIEGLTLDTYVRRYGPLAPARAVRIVRELANVLSEAHAANIVHRDVKPQNVVITANGQHPVLVDFGLSRVDASDRGGETPPNERAGTLRYSAPEQFKGHFADADPRADVFALGCVLLFTLSRHDPEGRSGRELLESTSARLADEIPGAAIPRPLRSIVKRCVDWNVDARYPNCRALIRDLDALLALLSVRERIEKDGVGSWTVASSTIRLVQLAIILGLLGAGLPVLAGLADGFRFLSDTTTSLGLPAPIRILLGIVGFAIVLLGVAAPMFLAAQLAERLHFLRWVLPWDRSPEKVDREVSELLLKDRYREALYRLDHYLALIDPREGIVAAKTETAKEASFTSFETPAMVRIHKLAPLYRLRARICRQLRDGANDGVALDELDQALRVAFLDSDVLLERARELEARGRHEEVLAHYRLAAQLDPDGSLGWRADLIGRLMKRSNLLTDLKERRSLLVEARTLEPTSVDVLAQFAALEETEEHYDEAADVLSQALVQSPGTPRLLEARARVYLALGNHYQAVRDCEEAAQREPASESLRALLVRAREIEPGKTPGPRVLDG